jgi:hypothetical protein
MMWPAGTMLRPFLVPVVLLVAALACWSIAVSAHRVVAIGDLHGDIENAREALRLAQVTDDEGNWNTGTDTVIQMGDLVDRGPHGHTIIDLLEELKIQALAAGGELITLLGNHELLNFQGDVKFVAPEHVAAFGGVAKWKAAFSTAHGRYGSIIVKRPTVVVRNHSVFVHAGITKEVASMGPLEDLNGKMETLLQQRKFTDPLLLNDGPVWTRRLIYAAQQGHCEETYAALQEINRVERVSNPTAPREVRRMVVGHTIQPNGAMRSFCNGTLVAIDISISQYMQGGGHLGHFELRPAATAHGEETPWFWYPSRPNARHALHEPSRPVDEEAGGSDVDAAHHQHPPAEAGHLSKQAAALSTRWRVTNPLGQHHAVTEGEKALFLAGIGLMVIVWRISHNLRSHDRMGAGKKSDITV